MLLSDERIQKPAPYITFMRLGIVDVGSLSLRFDIYEVHPDGSWELVEKLRSIPRIGEALFSTGAFLSLIHI